MIEKLNFALDVSVRLFGVSALLLAASLLFLITTAVWHVIVEKLAGW